MIIVKFFVAIHSVTEQSWALLKGTALSANIALVQKLLKIDKHTSLWGAAVAQW
jgi:hypothetical protein